MSASDDQAEKECPLCMEQLDLDELNFFPCKCGYQICQFCWNRIKEEENGLCPACRQPYPEQPADFKPLSAEELKKIQLERRKREQQRKQKMSENRKHLANLRVVQRNLVLVHGLPPRLSDAEILKRPEYFGQFGKIFKIVIGTNNLANNAIALNAAVAQVASASVYVTYNKEDDAVKAILALNQKQLDGRILRASLGTTKYCSSFLQNKPCQKTDCMYLHEVGDSEASFTKEDMAAKKHEEYERKVCDQIIARITQNRSTNSPPPTQQRGGDVFPLCSSDNNNSGKCRDSSVPPAAASSTLCQQQQQNNDLPHSPTPTSRHNNHTRNHPPPRHRNRPHSQMQLLNESKCTTISIDSVVDHAHRQSSPEPSHILQRSSTLDNSCLAQTSSGGGQGLAASVSALLQNGFGSASSPESSGPVNIVDQNESPTASSSSLPTSASSAAIFLQQQQQQQQQTLSNSLNAAPPKIIPPSLINWQNSRILAAIQHQQNQTSSHSLFSHDDDAFYRPKLKQLLQRDDPAIVAECSGVNKTTSSTTEIIVNRTLLNGLMNGDAGGHHGPTREPTEKPHDDYFVPPADNLNVRSHTDWQAAFGFGKTDDDLGFDPFSESSKALEDMVREEKEQQQRRDQLVLHHPHHHNSNSNQFQPQQIIHNQQQQHQNQQIRHQQQQQKGQQQSSQVQQNFWPHSPPQNVHYAAGGAGGHPFANDGCSGSHPGFISPGLFRPNPASDLPTNKLLNGALPGYNGLNAQAAPFIPRQLIPPQQQHRELNVKDIQEQFKELFPNANVKFTTQPPPSVAAPPPPPSAAGLMPPNCARSAAWPPRMPDPRQAMFTRPPPPLATNGPTGPGPLCFARPPMKLSPTGSDLPFHHHHHHHHPRLPGPPGPQFPTGHGAPMYSDFPGWSAAGGLAPTPPPGFASTHQNST